MCAIRPICVEKNQMSAIHNSIEMIDLNNFHLNLNSKEMVDIGFLQPFLANHKDAPS